MTASPQPLWPRLRAEWTALARLGVPLIVHNLATMGMQTTDTIMAGRLSARDLAGVAVGGSLWMPVFIFILGVLMALPPIVAHLYGARREAEIGCYVRQGAWLAMLAALAGMVLLWNARPLLAALGIEAEVIPLAAGYLRAISWGLPALCLYQVLRFASEGIGHTRPMLFIATAGLLLNIPANYVFMYGALGLPRLGAVGCGYASALVMWFMLALLVWYVRTQPLYRPLAIFARGEWPRAAAQRELLALGLPIGIGIFMEGSLFAAVALIMGTLGTTVVAAHQIAINFASIMFMVPLSLAMATTVRVGHAAGAGDGVQARFAGSSGIALCGAFMALSALGMVLLRDVIASAYTRDAEVAALAARLLVMAAIFQLSDGLQVSGAGALRGLKDTSVPAIITVIAYWGVGLPLAWYLGVERALGPPFVWAGCIAGLTVAAVLLNWRFWHISRQGRA